MRNEVFTAMIIKTVVFWAMTSVSHVVPNVMDKPAVSIFRAAGSSELLATTYKSSVNDP
jgi:hypothetical protein